MPTPPLSTDLQQEAVDAIAQHGSISAAARALGIPRMTLKHRARIAQANGVKAGNTRIAAPELPEEAMPTPELIDHLTKRFERTHRAKKAREWMPLTVADNQPYVLAFVGDPHVDTTHTNWPLLRRDVRLLNSPHVYPVGMGDYVNNWSGRLQRLWAGEELSQKQGWQLAKWLFGAVPWALLIKGNHDMWSGASDPLDWMATGTDAPLEDWQAKVTFRTPGGHEVRVWAAHSFKGHSQWNSLHGAGKQAKMSGAADIYVQGHHHEWAMSQHEDGWRGQMYWLLKARGYKFCDEYADVHMFPNQQHGATIAAVVDPRQDGPAAIHCYADLQHAINIVNLLRKEAA